MPGVTSRNSSHGRRSASRLLRRSPGRDEEEDIGRRIGADLSAPIWIALNFTHLGQRFSGGDVLPGPKREDTNVHGLEPATSARAQDVIVCRRAGGRTEADA